MGMMGGMDVDINQVRTWATKIQTLNPQGDIGDINDPDSWAKEMFSNLDDV